MKTYASCFHLVCGSEEERLMPCVFGTSVLVEVLSHDISEILFFLLCLVVLCYFFGCISRMVLVYAV